MNTRMMPSTVWASYCAPNPSAPRSGHALQRGLLPERNQEPLEHVGVRIYQRVSTEVDLEPLPMPCDQNLVFIEQLYPPAVAHLLNGDVMVHLEMDSRIRYYALVQTWLESGVVSRFRLQLSADPRCPFL
jgi:hypothetical protein